MERAFARPYDIHSLSKLVRKGFEAPAPEPFPTGLDDLDRLLPGGGLPLGHLTELTGGPASGKLSLTLALLARAVARDEGAALLDPGATVMPDVWTEPWLTRLLVVRGGGLASALRAADALLRSGAFAVVALDLSDTSSLTRDDPRKSLTRDDPWKSLTRDDPWKSLKRDQRSLRSHLIRLAREARQADAALLLLTDPAGPGAGALASLRLELRRSDDALGITVARSRLGRTGAQAQLALASNPRCRKEGPPCASPASTSPTSPSGSCAARTRP